MLQESGVQVGESEKRINLLYYFAFQLRAVTCCRTQEAEESTNRKPPKVFPFQNSNSPENQTSVTSAVKIPNSALPSVTVKRNRHLPHFISPSRLPLYLSLITHSRNPSFRNANSADLRRQDARDPPHPGRPVRQPDRGQVLGGGLRRARHRRYRPLPG